MSFQRGDRRHDFEVQCPYNKKHQMPFSKLWFHISKGCKDKREKGHKYDTCPYNCLHIVIKSGMERHIAQCRYNQLDSKKAEEADLFKEMQLVAAQQFGNNPPEKNVPQIQQQQQNKYNNKPQNEIPDWRKVFEGDSELEDDIKEINEISYQNYDDEFDDSFKFNKASSVFSKSFQSSAAKEKSQNDDNDSYYY
ncbi:unnamed protein product (macronuclear) [Paramecium tetraurelia]|uniref:CHHC U11-48K-type domain-containing protein n=1 Tax=Paramecium tetraurelia TaxID=5888 RepID=A0C9P6_PARTE|nr:uncharacterized protein GSPATT00006819001 [Paramecium tetraurelia]CAK67513.1 unnamed protein product [Paramecium tetraurelia]|eukprot:XP_001434910.1 hypothetical protein (macronuclear) [Paramecium tetraurelia strain d4-2]